MNTHEIRDRNGYLLATIYTFLDYQEIRDRNGTYKGKYDVKNNETRDRHGTYVGSGNLLMTLL
jgi:hypothetical protein